MIRQRDDASWQKMPRHHPLHIPASADSGLRVRIVQRTSGYDTSLNRVLQPLLDSPADQDCSSQKKSPGSETRDFLNLHYTHTTGSQTGSSCQAPRGLPEAVRHDLDTCRRTAPPTGVTYPEHAAVQPERPQRSAADVPPVSTFRKSPRGLYRLTFYKRELLSRK